MSSNRERTQRNLNPHREARLAMLVWNAEYAAQGGGSMDFWDSLPESRQRYVRHWLDQLDGTKRKAP